MNIFTKSACALFASALLGGCGATTQSTVAPTSPAPTSATAATAPATPLTLPAGYTATVFARGLQGPTQFISGPDGRLWLAQLAGDENAGTGQIVSLAMDGSDPQVLLRDVSKPTGLAVIGQTLWVAAGRTLLRAPITGGSVGTPETVLKDLPFNGRSNGTLTVMPNGHLLFETSGSITDGKPTEGSGTLWELDPAAPATPRPLATGLKGAYARGYDNAGRLWSGEIGDDAVNGTAPPDELDLIVDGANFGWPQCFGKGEAALNFGGTAAACQSTRMPVALFPQHATPVGVVASPWEPDVLLVSLWASSRFGVARVPVQYSGDNASGEPAPFITGLQNPQHLLVLPDKSLLVGDWSAGVIYRVTKSG